MIFERVALILADFLQYIDVAMLVTMTQTKLITLTLVYARRVIMGSFLKNGLSTVQGSTAHAQDMLKMSLWSNGGSAGANEALLYKTLGTLH